MLPSPQGYSSASSASYPLGNFPNVTGATYSSQQSYLPQSLQEHSLHQGVDPNSPEVFRQNLQIVQDAVTRLQNSTRAALAGIQNAYHPGNSPAQTAADIATVKQTLQFLYDTMRQTGVGALPLLPSPDGNQQSVVPTEEQMMETVTHSVQALYDQLKRSQESAAIVANLLAAPEQGTRTSR